MYPIGHSSLNASFNKNHFLPILIAQFLIIPFFFHIDSVGKSLFFSSYVLVFFTLSTKKLVFCRPVILLLTIVCFLMFISPVDMNTGISGLFLVLLLFFLAWISGTKEIETIFSAFINAYIFFILVVSLLGLYEYFSFTLSGRSSGMLVPYLLPPDANLRVGSIYGQPNFLALVLLTGIIAYVYQHIHADQFSIRRMPILKYLPMLIVGVVFFLTGSRAGLLGLLFSALFVFWMIIRNRYLGDDPKKKKELLRLVVVVLIGASISWTLNYYFSGEASRGLSDTGISTDARFLFWTTAFLIFFDHPWLGIGFDRFQLYLPKYINQAYDRLGFVEFDAMGHTAWAHNELLQLLCENGILAFGGTLLLIGLFLWQFLRFATGKRQWRPIKFYSHLLVFPFILQSMFSWPMRHPAILILFMTFSGFLLAQYPLKRIEFYGWKLIVLKGGAILGLMLLLYVGFVEMKMANLMKEVRSAQKTVKVSDVKALANNPYAKFPLLKKLMPELVYYAVENNDKSFSRELLPLAEELVSLQGTHWQWYNLCLLQIQIGNLSDAKISIGNAIELRPTKQTYWAYQHYMNMLNAAKKTGRPFSEFLPLPKGGVVRDLEGMYDFDRVRFDINKI